MMSGILAKEADEFCDEFGRCVSRNTCFPRILQNRPDVFSDEFCDEFQTHRGQRAGVSRECLEQVGGEMSV